MRGGVDLEVKFRKAGKAKGEILRGTGIEGKAYNTLRVFGELVISSKCF
jgi:hypothetical protein